MTAVKCKGCNRTMETTCHDAKIAYERIYDKSKLQPGDHICWHRPLAYWHHAIISQVNREERKIIEYSDYKVTESVMLNNDNKYNALYRVNYQDCYDADYTILRARRLIGEEMYNLMERNCEHISRWCKTGRTKSIQVRIFLESLQKIAFTSFLRFIALVIVLGFIAYIHEKQEDTVKYSKWLETLERWLTGFYISAFAVVFTIYLLRESGSRLHPVGMRGHDTEHKCTCCSPSTCCKCCSVACCSLISLIKYICSLIFCSFDPSSCTCCRRPCNLVCGLFCRIVIRETLATALTLTVVLNEESITNQAYMAEMSAFCRAALLILYSTLAHIAGCICGALLGRWAEACSNHRYDT